MTVIRGFLFFFYGFSHPTEATAVKWWAGEVLEGQVRSVAAWVQGDLRL